MKNYWNKFIKFLTMSKTSPKGGKRACLCKDGKYSKECCTGELHAQGIGSDKHNATATVVNVNTQRVINN
jgi:hypothetical protein